MSLTAVPAPVYAQYGLTCEVMEEIGRFYSYLPGFQGAIVTRLDTVLDEVKRMQASTSVAPIGAAMETMASMFHANRRRACPLTEAFWDVCSFFANEYLDMRTAFMQMRAIFGKYSQNWEEFFSLFRAYYTIKGEYNKAWTIHGVDVRVMQSNIQQIGGKLDVLVNKFFGDHVHPSDVYKGISNLTMCYNACATIFHEIVLRFRQHTTKYMRRTAQAITECDIFLQLAASGVNCLLYQELDHDIQDMLYVNGEVISKRRLDQYICERMAAGSAISQQPLL